MNTYDIKPTVSNGSVELKVNKTSPEPKQNNTNHYFTRAGKRLKPPLGNRPGLQILHPIKRGITASKKPV